MTELYKLLKELSNTDQIMFTNNGSPYFLEEARDKIIKHCAKEGDLIDDLASDNSNAAALDSGNYFHNLELLVWKALEKDLVEESYDWIDFIEWIKYGKHKEAHESIQETSLMEMAKRNHEDFMEGL